MPISAIFQMFTLMKKLSVVIFLITLHIQSLRSRNISVFRSEETIMGFIIMGFIFTSCSDGYWLMTQSYSYARPALHRCQCNTSHILSLAWRYHINGKLMPAQQRQNAKPVLAMVQPIPVTTPAPMETLHCPQSARLPCHHEASAPSV